jgi:hypothetical protein
MLLNPVVLTATLTGVTVPTGSVNFLDGTTLLGTGTISNGVATLTITTLAVGTHAISALYSGDINFTSVANATPISELVQDFSLVISVSSGGGSVTSITALPGSTAVYSFTVSPLNATTFPANVTLSASGLPSGATCIFSPAALAAGSGTQTVMLTVQIPQTDLTSQLLRIRGSDSGPQIAAAGMQGNPIRGRESNTARHMAPLALALLLLPFAGRMRRRLPGMLCNLLLLGIALTAAVGSGGCGSTGSGYFGQAASNYTITVTGAAGPLTHSTSVTLTVQ